MKQGFGWDEDIKLGKMSTFRNICVLMRFSELPWCVCSGCVNFSFLTFSSCSSQQL